jgi:hypothetical protein
MRWATKADPQMVAVRMSSRSALRIPFFMDQISDSGIKSRCEAVIRIYVIPGKAIRLQRLPAVTQDIAWPSIGFRLSLWSHGGTGKMITRKIEH